MSDNAVPPAEQEDRAAALARLVPRFYEELRALARARLRQERPDHSLQATALVHEVYLRLLGANGLPAWKDREHFIVAAAESMRRVLVDHARRRLRQKRGGGQIHIELSAADAADDQDLDEILMLDEAFFSSKRAMPAPPTSFAFGTSPASASRRPHERSACRIGR